MSSNSWPRILATAPIVSALRGRDADSLDGGRRSASVRPLTLSSAVAIANSALQVAQLVLADLDLVAVIEPVRLDPAPVHVSPVQRAQVVDVKAVLAPDDESVVSRHRHVVQEHCRVGRAADAHAVAVDREALSGASAAGPDDEGRARLVDLLVLAGLADLVGHRRRVLALGAGQVGPALLAVVGALGIYEPALRAVQRQS